MPLSPLPPHKKSPELARPVADISPPPQAAPPSPVFLSASANRRDAIRQIVRHLGEQFFSSVQTNRPAPNRWPAPQTPNSKAVAATQSPPHIHAPSGFAPGRKEHPRRIRHHANPVLPDRRTHRPRPAGVSDHFSAIVFRYSQPDPACAIGRTVFSSSSSAYAMNAIWYPPRAQ